MSASTRMLVTIAVEQHRRLKLLAALTGENMTTIINRLIDHELSSVDWAAIDAAARSRGGRDERE